MRKTWRWYDGEEVHILHFHEYHRPSHPREHEGSKRLASRTEKHCGIMKSIKGDEKGVMRGGD